MKRASRACVRLALFASMTVGGWACPARADAPGERAADSRGITTNARERFRQGVAAYAGGHYMDAIALFREADQIAPSAALSFNVARAYDKLGDVSGALEWYRDYLRRAREATDRSDVQRLVDSLEQRLKSKGVQQVTVLSQPRGATVQLDGQPVGVTPFTTDVKPGVHRVAVSMRGYADIEREFLLPPDDALDVDMRLERVDPDDPADSEPAPGLGRMALPQSRPMGLIDESPLPARRSWMPIAGWVGVGAGTAALGGALVFEVLRRDAVDAARRDDTQVGYSDKLQTVENRRTAARVLAGTGGVLVVAGASLLLFGSRAPKAETATATRVSLACASQFCGAELGGSF